MRTPFGLLPSVLLPFVLAVPVLAQPMKLLGSDLAQFDQFGNAVALSADGRYALVGVPEDDVSGLGADVGSAYVFVRTAAGWDQQAFLQPDGLQGQDEFADAIALSANGEYALAGAYLAENGAGDRSGVAFVFERSGSAWSVSAELVPAGAENLDGAGSAVALSSDGQTALVGAPFVDAEPGADTGSAYVFTRDQTGWSQQAQLTADDAAQGDFFGSAVALSNDGHVALVAAPADDDGGVGAGSLYVFVRDGAGWMQQAKLTADDAEQGDAFGTVVTLSSDGGVALIGAPTDDTDAGQGVGSAYVFARAGTAWTQQAKLEADDGNPNTEDRFGGAVALSGDGTYAVVGAPRSSGVGAAYVFAGAGPAWAELAALTGSGSDGFGSAVALSGADRYALIGAPLDDEVAFNAGAAYVYDSASLPVSIAGAPAAATFVLHAPTPNPFHTRATIAYELAQPAHVRLVAFDLLGRRVAVLVDAPQPAGPHAVDFEAAGLPTGVYLVHAQAGAGVATRRVMLVR